MKIGVVVVLLGVSAFMLLILALALNTGYIHLQVFDPSQYPQALLQIGNRSLLANWDAGHYNITADYFKGNIIGNLTGTLALSHLNISDWATYIDQAVKTNSNVSFNTVKAFTIQGLGNDTYNYSYERLLHIIGDVNVTGVYPTFYMKGLTPYISLQPSGWGGADLELQAGVTEDFTGVGDYGGVNIDYSGQARNLVLGVQPSSPSYSGNKIYLYSNGTVRIGTNIAHYGLNGLYLTKEGKIYGATTLDMSGQLTNTVATGTSPFVISSTSLITNLNSDLLDSQHGSYYRNATNIDVGTLSLTYIPTMDDAHIPNVETLSYGATFAKAQIPILDSYQYPLALLLNGTRAITGNLNMDNNGISNSGNIAMSGASTVDGVDISALLIKTAKITDLGTIWDKTTKIAFGDTVFSDQALKTTSSPTFYSLSLTDSLTNPLTLKTSCFNPIYPGMDYKIVLDLKLDEATGTTCFDSSQYRNDGTIVSATWTTGRYGEALNFSGNAQYVNLGNDASLNVGAGGTDMTISAWIYPTQDRNGYIVCKRDSASSTLVKWGMLLASGRYIQMFGYQAPVNLQSASTIPLNEWTYVTCVWSGTTGYIYLNGTLDNTGSITNALGSSIGINILIGARYSTAPTTAIYFEGKIDNPKIFARVVSAEEINAMYQMGPGIYSSSFVVSNKFSILQNSTFTELFKVTSTGISTSGTGTFTTGAITRYDAGDYGLAWATYTPPTGTLGLVIIVYNSNAGVLASRIYAYSGGAWHYAALT